MTATNDMGSKREMIQCKREIRCKRKMIPRIESESTADCGIASEWSK